VTVLQAPIHTLARLQPLKVTGRVSALRGLTVLVSDLPAPIGSLVSVQRPVTGAAALGHYSGGALGEVVGFSDGMTAVMMLGTTSGIRPGDRVVGLQAAQTVQVSDALLGRCLDGLGRPIDGLGSVLDAYPRELVPTPTSALERRRIREALPTGVRAIDLFNTLARGQRMGIFAGPGVGKSTLLGCVARNTSADVNVIALIGERGREVRDFIEHNLGPEGLARSVVVVATSDESPLMRVRAALVAASVAEHFRDEGRDVMLMMDSVTRFAHAQRQIGLSVGEPPATRGYTPSVFAAMARLLERAGAFEAEGGARPGSITGLYAILVEGDDMTEPVADAARGILDGHIILSRQLAQRGHYPAVDVLDSVSRLADEVTEPALASARRQIVRLLAAYRQVEDLVLIGAYAKGSSAESDVAIAMYGRIAELLRQGTMERESFQQASAGLIKLAAEAGAALSHSSKGR
jgi:flagellum-specific ATP synthase